jgi:hypothetical protein
MTGIACYAVYVVPSGRHASPKLVGPFVDAQEARRYCERIEQSANGTLRAEVVTMSSP